MSRNGNTALWVGSTVIALGSYFGYQRMRERKLPPSPIAVESPEDRAESIQAAFATAAAVEDADVQAFIADLQRAVVEGDTATVSSMVSVSRMLDAVDASSGQKLPGFARTMLESQLDTELVEFFDATVVDTTIKRIDRDSEGNIVVYLRMVDRDRILVKARWWLFHDGDGLRWWDGEDLQLGLRLSTTMAAGIAAAAEGGNPRDLERFVAALSELAELSFDDPVRVRAFSDELDALELRSLPASFQNLAILTRAATATALGDPQGALDRLDALDGAARGLDRLDFPVRHFQRAEACIELERWDEAATAAQRFLDLLGDDADTFHLLGVAELRRGDPAAALAAFDAGIADDPLNTSNYAGVAIASPDVAAVTERLRKVPDVAMLGEIADRLVSAEEAAALGRMLDAAANHHPQWDIEAWRNSVDTRGVPDDALAD